MNDVTEMHSLRSTAGPGSRRVKFGTPRFK
jgi:hypothetical protein